MQVWYIIFPRAYNSRVTKEEIYQLYYTKFPKVDQESFKDFDKLITVVFKHEFEIIVYVLSPAWVVNWFPIEDRGFVD